MVFKLIKVWSLTLLTDGQTETPILLKVVFVYHVENETLKSSTEDIRWKKILGNINSF